MYCKNCGRQLKEGMRFCDRCGQSVRKNKQIGQSTAKQREIEELKNERLNRKKRLAEKEAKQVRNKKRKKKNGSGFVFFIVVLLIAIVSMIIGYNIFGGGSSKKTPPSASPGVASTITPIKSPEVSKNGYATIKVGSVNCPYPATFHSNTTTGNEKLNITDAFGGATMIISQEAKMGEAKDLMAEYASECGSVSYSRAGNDWYSVTSESGGVITHRKCVVRNGLSVFYDFSYNSDSSSSEKYTEYIEYIDANFK